VDSLDLGQTGYDLDQLAVLPAGLQTGLQFPPSRLVGFRRDPNGRLDFRVEATEGPFLLLETSTNLVKWEPFVTLPSWLGALQIAEPSGAWAPRRFYRIKAFVPASTVVEPTPGNARGDLP
jgi:hypothetical protein